MGEDMFVELTVTIPKHILQDCKIGWAPSKEYLLPLISSTKTFSFSLSFLLYITAISQALEIAYCKKDSLV